MPWAVTSSGCDHCFQNLLSDGPPVDLLGESCSDVPEKQHLRPLNADITVFRKRHVTVAPTGIKVGDQCFQYRASLRYIPDTGDQQAACSRRLHHPR